MNKQNLFTAAGVAFALFIVFGGWFLTDRLLEEKEASLLSGTGNVPVSVSPPPAEPDEEPVLPVLSESEIFTILSVWELDGEEMLHEPEEGQLTMEQAIQAGQSGLSFLAGLGIVPEELVDSGKIHAVLGEKKEDAARLLPDNPSLRPEEIRTLWELHPFYSYWTVSFSTEQAGAVLTINAMTGQIWKAESDSAGPADGASDKAAHEEWTDAFLEYLDLTADSLLLTVSVKEGGYETEEGVSRRTVSLSLTNRY